MVKEIESIVSYDRIYIVNIKNTKYSGPRDIYYFFLTYSLLNLLPLVLHPTHHVDLTP